MGLYELMIYIYMQVESWEWFWDYVKYLWSWYCCVFRGITDAYSISIQPIGGDSLTFSQQEGFNASDVRLRVVSASCIAYFFICAKEVAIWMACHINITLPFFPHSISSCHKQLFRKSVLFCAVCIFDLFYTQHRLDIQLSSLF